MFDFEKAVEYIHKEIASNGTSSEFVGRGLNVATGEYDAEEIASAIENGEFPKLTGLFE